MVGLFLLLTITSMLHSGERKVLVEMFTNSHCTVCPGAHAAINAFKATSPNANRVNYIFYHTTFPYSDDQLSVVNTTEPNARNSYYNGPTSTPNTFFDGVNQGRTYSSFASNLETRLGIESPFVIKLSGSMNGSTVSITATITKTGIVSQNELVVYFVAVENVSYVGRNGVSPQDFVMRKMLSPVSGSHVMPDSNGIIGVVYSGTIPNVTEMNKTGVVVFLQSTSTKEVFQSEYISYSSLTSVSQHQYATPINFSLDQNFPNPFNPSTTISFSIPQTSDVSLTVYNTLGIKVTVIENGRLSAGSYSRQFSAAHLGLSSGIYFYRLEAMGKSIVRTMMLIK